jgi:hypothetical protein
MILADLKKLIFDFADANGADWLALITGGIFPGRAPDCAAGQTPKTPYCVWDWIGASDIRTATDLRDRLSIQFVLRRRPKKSQRNHGGMCRSVRGQLVGFERP